MALAHAGRRLHPHGRMAFFTAATGSMRILHVFLVCMSAVGVAQEALSCRQLDTTRVGVKELMRRLTSGGPVAGAALPQYRGRRFLTRWVAKTSRAFAVGSGVSHGRPL